MNYCPITYEPISESQQYSDKGLRQLSKKLTRLLPLQYDAEEQHREALARVGKMSIQGVQPKLSAKLDLKTEQFKLVDCLGDYLLKLQSLDYPQLPENESLTMKLADVVGLQVPVNGLIYCKDNSMTYFIKRFDKHQKIKYAVEDFAQLAGNIRQTKYNSSMEKVANLIINYTSFPKIELIKLFKLTLFNYLVGNEDMHLKNFSLITINDKTTLSPPYDLLNTTIAQKYTKEELALPLHGKKNNLNANDFIRYFGKDVLTIPQPLINNVLDELQAALPKWHDFIDCSWLTPNFKEKYHHLLEQRRQKLNL